MKSKLNNSTSKDKILGLFYKEENGNFQNYNQSKQQQMDNGVSLGGFKTILEVNESTIFNTNNEKSRNYLT